MEVPIFAQGFDAFVCGIDSLKSRYRPIEFYGMHPREKHLQDEPVTPTLRKRAREKTGQTISPSVGCWDGELVMTGSTHPGVPRGVQHLRPCVLVSAPACATSLCKSWIVRVRDKIETLTSTPTDKCYRLPRSHARRGFSALNSEGEDYSRRLVTDVACKRPYADDYSKLARHFEQFILRKIGR